MKPQTDSKGRVKPVAGLEAGLAAVPINPSETGCVRMAVITRLSPDAASGHLVLVRQLPIGKILLGCLQDEFGAIIEWIEIWIQETSNDGEQIVFAGSTNSQLDQRWREIARALREMDPQLHISSRFESDPPLPSWFDLKHQTIIHPRDGEGTAWELCRDDRLLENSGLPSYSGSSHRYVCLPDRGEQTQFIAVSPNAPANDRVLPAERLLDRTEAIPINPSAGLMLFRRYAPLGLEQYVELVAGKPWRGLENAHSAIRLDEPYSTLQDESTIRCGGAHLFGSNTGRSGRFAETLHLKLELITQATRLVRDYIRRTTLPLLNITAESFRSRLFPVGTGLPLLWSSRVTLDRPGAGLALPIANSSTRLFRSSERFSQSIYRPEHLSLSTRGVASVRIRKVLPPIEAGIVLEGTFSTQERLQPDRNDLATFQVPISNGQATLFGYLDRGEKLPEGELRFRTVPQTMSAELEGKLRAIEGIPFNQVGFEIVPPLSSPCDLYSLGVLAIRVLLVNPRVGLPYALDAMLSLARELANNFDENRPIEDRVSQILASDARWGEALGAQHLVHEEIPTEEVDQFLPPRLWSDVLALFVRFFPGMGPDSFCRDFGDAHSLAPETIFDEPLRQLEHLCLRSRSLLLLNWKQHIEVAKIIQSIEDSLT